MVLLLVGCLMLLGVLVGSGAEPQCDPSWQNIVDTQNDGTVYYKPTNENFFSEDTSTLRLVHVVFRHGDRAADPDAQYPLDPYRNFTYYPVGLGQLTNVGKRQEYAVGKTLRKRYDDFLGSVYLPEILDARSTDVNRTKASLELVLAGLWPPMAEQIWNYDLPWQPIPYNYWRANEDRVLGDPNVMCPRYQELYNKNQLSEENVSENDKLKSFYNYVNYYTGLNMTVPIDVYNIYFTFRAEEGWGLELPPWTDCIWPDKFLDVALKQYELFTQTPELTGLSAGLLLQKIIDDSTAKISGSLSPEERKIFLYSGHERNIALTLIALGVYYPHMPPYASYVLLELHEIDGVYGFKIFYEDYTENQPRLMTIPGCTSFCPVNKFVQLIEKNLPKKSCDL